MININEFVKLLEEEFEDVESGLLSPEFSYRDIPDFSSMHALIIIAFIDNEYDVLLTGQELKETETVLDLFKLVSSKIKN